MKKYTFCVSLNNFVYNYFLDMYHSQVTTLNYILGYYSPGWENRKIYMAILCQSKFYFDQRCIKNTKWKQLMACFVLFLQIFMNITEKKVYFFFKSTLVCKDMGIQDQLRHFNLVIYSLNIVLISFENIKLDLK